MQANQPMNKTTAKSIYRPKTAAAVILLLGLRRDGILDYLWRFEY